MKKNITGSDLFSGDADWHNNACLNFVNDHGWGYAEGYRRAAELLTQHIDTHGRDQDLLVYPLVFLYRHHIELAIKRIITLSLLMVDDPSRSKPKASHNLNTLWAAARKLLREVDATFPRANHKNTDCVIKELNRIDERSTAFRYDRTQDGDPSLQGITLINTRRFSQKIKAASDELSCMDSHISYLLGLHEDMMSDAGYQPD